MDEKTIREQIMEWYATCNNEQEIYDLDCLLEDAMTLSRDCRKFDLSKND